MQKLLNLASWVGRLLFWLACSAVYGLVGLAKRTNVEVVASECERATSVNPKTRSHFIAWFDFRTCPRLHRKLDRKRNHPYKPDIFRKFHRTSFRKQTLHES